MARSYRSARRGRQSFGFLHDPLCSRVLSVKRLIAAYLPLYWPDLDSSKSP